MERPPYFVLACVPFRRSLPSFLALYVAFLFPFALPSAGVAQTAPPFSRAQWIAPPDGPQKDRGIDYFRRILTETQPPAKLQVHVSADARFLLYVNGAFAGEGPAHSDLAHWKYETFDLAPYLRKGENVIAAVVWNLGVDAAAATVSSRTAFLMESADPADSTLDTNDAWEVEPATGREPISLDYSKVLLGYYAAPPGERIDGTRYDWQWSTSGAAVGAWKHAASIGTPAPFGKQNGATIWALQPDTLPPMERSPVAFGKIVRSDGFTHKDIPAHTHAHILFDRGALTTAYPAFTFSGGRGATIRATYAEALLDGQNRKGNRNEIAGRHILGVADEFTTDGGDHRTFTPLEWRAWRYLELDIATAGTPLHLDDATATFTAFPFHLAGSFQSEDPELSRIWQTSWLTARLDAHDTYMDTPYWERLQYVGDTRLQALISYSLAGDDRLARQAIDAIDHSRTADGLTQSRYPSNLPQIIPPFSLLWIGMVHDFWMYRDDPSYVQSHLPGVETVLRWHLAHQRPDGLLGTMPWWNFGDWSKGFHFGVPPQDPDGGSSLLTLQFIEALRNAAHMETPLGQPAIAALYQEAADRAANALRTKCWNGSLGLIADTPAQNHYSQQANALAVWLHVVPPGSERAVMQTVLRFDDPAYLQAHPGVPFSTASYYFRFYLARGLEAAGLSDRYLDTLGPWRQMIALGLSTWAEEPEPTRSDSHAWSAHPAYDMLRLVAGISPAEPGFATVLIEPHPGTLKAFSAKYPHPRGEIAVTYRQSELTDRFEIAMPRTLAGVFRWQGKTYALRQGAQTFDIPRSKER
ncbi:alpha-L-rhamnosidase [Granulicella rosea]|uniref:Alpha-L-rhamnosidase n=1 Tax=Granulicella rosea TaxID=474952 RepID=A0A239MNI4_9BACT|nr:alpha-L-rhamnosidase C-terminal domain-containing protein [Granulicella rosea]SNT43672.1 alpha-L-rhamnosidase [Granulicella rosea]